jgi:hypothetical protein
MGIKLNGYYQQVITEFGTLGRVKFAMLTKVSSEKATMAPDSPETVQMFEAALVKLRQTMPK